MDEEEKIWCRQIWKKSNGRQIWFLSSETCLNILQNMPKLNAPKTQSDVVPYLTRNNKRETSVSVDYINDLVT